MVSIHKTYTNLALLLCLTLLLAQTASAQFTGRTWSQFSVNGEVVGAKAVCDDDDRDNDDDGLIELCHLEDVDAMRHQPDGSGYKESDDDDDDKITTGCKSGGCIGYELVRDLDFDDDDSYESTSTNNVKVNWTTGEGWQPIGTSSENFNSIFEGNGHTISNLMINKPNTDDVGLFGKTSDSSKISNIGLLNVQIDGNFHVGGLVGQNNGSIANSYATGSVAGT